jgi:hypothetical protein
MPGVGRPGRCQRPGAIVEYVGATHRWAPGIAPAGASATEKEESSRISRGVFFELCHICDQLRLSVPGLCLGVPGKRGGKLPLEGVSDEMRAFVLERIRASGGKVAV